MSHNTGLQATHYQGQWLAWHFQARTIICSSLVCIKLLSIISFIPCIAGGYDGDDYRDEIYSHAGGSQGEWKEAGRLMTKRGYSAAALLIVNSDSCK